MSARSSTAYAERARPGPGPPSPGPPGFPAPRGHRAPLVIGNHVDEWRGNACNPVVFDRMDEVCGKLDTSGATYSDVIAWMELPVPRCWPGCRPGARCGDPAGRQRCRACHRKSTTTGGWSLSASPSGAVNRSRGMSWLMASSRTPAPLR